MSSPTDHKFKSLIKAVQRSQRQLSLTNIPIRLTAEHLRQSEANIKQLETHDPENLHDAVTILIQSTRTRALIKHVLKTLNIRDPVYASAVEMQQDSRLARHEMTKRLDAAMARGDVDAVDQERCRTVLAALLDGEDPSIVASGVERMIVGLLHGTKQFDLLRECPPDVRGGLARLIHQVRYKELSHAVGSSSQMRALPVPAGFHLQSYDAGEGGSASASAGTGQMQLAGMETSATGVWSDDVLLQRVESGEETGSKGEKGMGSAATKKRARERARRAERIRAEEKAAKTREASKSAPTYQSPF